MKKIIVLVLCGLLVNQGFLFSQEKVSADEGWKSYHLGLYEKALGEFQKLGEDSPAALRGIGYAYNKLGKYDEAEEALKKVIESDPGLKEVAEYIQSPGSGVWFLIMSDAQSTLAWNYYYKKDYKNAIRTFKDVLKRHSDWIDPYDGLGWVYIAEGSYDKAEEAFNKALKLNPNYSDALSGLAFLRKQRYAESNIAWGYYYAGAYSKAIESFEKVMDDPLGKYQEKEKWVLVSGIAWSNYFKGDYDEAYAAFRKESKTKQGVFDAYKGLGYIEMRREKFDRAIKFFKKALGIVAEDVAIHINLGWAYYNQGNYNKARESFEKAVNINSYLFESHKGLALSLYHSEDYEKAKEEFVKSISIFPGYVENEEFRVIVGEREDWINLYNVVGWAYYNMGLQSKAYNAFGKVLKKNPYNDEALKGRGFSSFYLVKYDETVNNLKKLLGNIPETEKGWGAWSAVLSTLGWSNYYIKDYVAAIDTFDKLISLHKEDDFYADPWTGLGWSYVGKEMFYSAKEAFQKALERAPGYKPAMDGLAVAEKGVGGKKDE